jgi:serine/threonine protein kinase
MMNPGSRLGPYEIIGPIGSGGMGEVYKARDTRLGRTVAVKVLPGSVATDPERRRRFEQEARAASALNHPHICVLYDIGSDAGTDFLVMEYLEGQSLAERLVKGPLPLEQVLQVGTQIAGALDRAHRQGIIHRDLKPGNVMLTRSGAKLLDFGLAKLTQPDSPLDWSERSTVSEPVEGMVTGTLYYMSPEQVQGLPVDHRSDVFSMGVMLYEMATGRRPFDGANPAAVIASILRDSPVPPTRLIPELPLRLGRIIDRCLKKDPRHRWQSFSELLRRLEDLRGDLGSAARALDRSIAVLPFTDMSPERDQDYLCEGIAEEILIALGRVKGLRVASRPAAFRFKTADGDLSEIGARLQVSTLLDGSVRKSGDRLRVTVQLIDVADLFCLWSERYDRDMRDVFAVQDEIAQQVVAALEVTLSSSEKEALQKLATADVDAYDCYLRGRKFFYKYDKRGITFARELFERAIEIDPAYGRAYAGVADCCAYLYMYAGRDQANLERAIVAARKALEIDPELAEAHASLGTALSFSGCHGEAEAAFQAAIRLNPELFEAHYFYARDSFVQGRLEQAAAQYEAASRARPEDFQSPLLVAQLYADLGRPDAAEVSRRLGVAIAEEHLKLNPDDARALYMGANGLVALGENEKGLEWAGRAVAMEPDDPMLLYNVACIYSLAGRAEEALDCVERTVNAGFAQREYLEHDSNLDLIRGDRRFQALLARLP